MSISSKVIAITPVGPGHERFIRRCRESIQDAGIEKHIIIDDTQGKLGRSAARNLGMDKAEWYFFIDADDLAEPNIIKEIDSNYDAIFGEVKVEGKVLKTNIYPKDWEDLKRMGPKGTLSMGFFIKSHIAQNLRFNETMDKGEDFDFYCRLAKKHSFIKLHRPLVNITKDPSAGGPRGYTNIDWIGECNKVMKSYE